MAKIKFNSIVDEVSGGFGNVVFRVVRGKTIMARRPDLSGNEASEGQEAHRERFREAVAYGKSAMADDTMRKFYEQVAKERDIPVFALTVADFFNAPTINDMDVTGYAGKVNDVIKIKSLDDFGVMRVHVTLSEAQTDVPIENGDAIETATGSGQWIYMATAAVSAGTNVRINVVATDRPGGMAVDSRIKTAS